MSSQEILKKCIEKFGTQSKLAFELGVTHPAISVWKSGAKPIPDDKLAAMASILDLDPLRTLAECKGGLWGRVAAKALQGALICVLALPYG